MKLKVFLENPACSKSSCADRHSSANYVTQNVISDARI